jgi:hypothetical protein
MCELTEGRDTTCDSAGGSKKAYLFSMRDSLGLSNYATKPTVVDGEITAMAFKPSKFLHAFNVESESIEANANSIGEAAKNSTAYEHSVVIQLAGNTKEDIAMATKICKGRVGVILELNDGTFEAYHYEDGIGGKVQRNRTPGKLLDDMNGATLTITSRQTMPEAKISSTLVNSLLAPPPAEPEEE